MEASTSTVELNDNNNSSSADVQTSNEVIELRLTIMRLKEQLHAYDNGMTPTDFVTIIAEKDVQIESLTANLTDTKQKLRELARKSAEVLSKHEILAEEKAENELELKAQIEKLQLDCATLLMEKTKQKEKDHGKIREYAVSDWFL
jgi:uncharacterized Zn finger protein